MVYVERFLGGKGINYLRTCTTESRLGDAAHRADAGRATAKTHGTPAAQ